MVENLLSIDQLDYLENYCSMKAFEFLVEEKKYNKSYTKAVNYFTLMSTTLGKMKKELINTSVKEE